MNSEKKANPILNVLKAIWNFIEVYLPGVFLFGLFVLFIVQVAMRYIFRNPLTWSFELTLVLYLWTILLASCNCMRTDDHVKFTMVYDAVSEKTRAWMDIIAALLFVVVVIISLPSIVDYCWFTKVASLKKTTVLKIQYKYIYIVFLYMICSTGIMQIVKAGKRIKQLITKDPALEKKGE